MDTSGGQNFRTVTPELRERIGRAAGGRVVEARTVDRGYSPALRLRVTLADGRRVFAKAGTIMQTGEALRREKRIYDALGDRSFLPRVLGWDDGGEPNSPVLVLEDLSAAHWPPPWEAGQVNTVRDAAEAVWACHVPDLPRVAEEASLFDGWVNVAADPAPFLSLGLATEKWLDAALPTLLAVDGPAAVAGDALLHCDLRSDNLCLRPETGRAVLIDWNHASLGSPRLDLGAWLPSLEAEGGPAPETLLPDAGDIAAVLAGYFASRAGLPILPELPRVREIQTTQARTALPWAARSLDLPPPDGPNAPPR
jgi:thiamine kinase-like enzyme